MSNLTFTTQGCRWRAHRLDGEPLPPPHDTRGETVTGLLFESDDAEPRLLHLARELLPSADELRAAPADHLGQMLSWAGPIPR